jgi:hypothetical protein
MPLTPKREEIDHRTIKLIVGAVAITLPAFVVASAGKALDSISAAYHVGGPAGSFFVGFLFAIAAFLAAYNGVSPREMVLSKIAAVAALGVALAPCECNGEPAPIPYVHGFSAAVMFLILTFFCREFYKRAQAKGYPEAKVRAKIYTVCGITIFSMIVILAFDSLLGKILDWSISSRYFPRLVFWCETFGLVAFGISWLTASRTIPLNLISKPEERFHPLQTQNPDS